MYQTCNSSNRIVKGCQPNAIGIIARKTNSTKAKFENILAIDYTQVKEEIELNKFEKEKNDKYVRDQWFEESDKKADASFVKRRVQDMIIMNEEALNCKRDRLRKLLESDKHEFTNLYISNQENNLDKQARLREEARRLKEKKEAERLALVKVKLDQQFIENCDDLRSINKILYAKQLNRELTDQQIQKRVIEEDIKCKDRMYADLWLQDAKIKEEKELTEKSRRLELDRENSNYLISQMEELEEKKKEEKFLQEEELQILLEQNKLEKLYQEKLFEEKRRKLIELKEDHTKSVRAKREAEIAENQIQAEFDLKLIRGLLDEKQKILVLASEKKRQYIEEQKRYMEYATKLKHEKLEALRLIDEQCQNELTCLWQKRTDKWNTEKKARRAFLENIFEGRSQQIEEKRQRNIMRQEEAKQAKELMLIELKASKNAEREEINQIRNKNAVHKNDLLKQMKFNQKILEEECLENNRILSKQQEAENAYINKIKELSMNIGDGKNKSINELMRKTHPMKSREISALPSISRAGRMN